MQFEKHNTFESPPFMYKIHIAFFKIHFHFLFIFPKNLDDIDRKFIVLNISKH